MMRFDIRDPKLARFAFMDAQEAVGPFAGVRYDNRATLAKLLLEISRLPFPIGPNGPWIAGGSIVRALIGRPGQTFTDFDVWLPSWKSGKACSTILRSDLWTARGRGSDEDLATEWDGYYLENGKTPEARARFAAERSLGMVPSLLKVDLIGSRFFNSPEEIVATFDIAAAQVVTDGTSLWMTDAAVAAFLDEDLVVLRETRKERIVKYLDMGFTPKGHGAPSALMLREGLDLPGWFRKNMNREEALGLVKPKVPIDSKVPPIDFSKLVLR